MPNERSASYDSDDMEKKYPTDHDRPESAFDQRRQKPGDRPVDRDSLGLNLRES